MTDLPTTTRELVSTLTDDGTISFSVRETDLREMGPGDLLVRVEAAPINPSDLGLMFGGADLSEAVDTDAGLTAQITAGLGSMSARFGTPMPCGNEGAGTVIAAGSGAEELVGRVVGFVSGPSYAQYRVLNQAQCLVMHEGTTAEQAAAWFVNPLTALGMTETMRREGHTALVHTVGASNLGQMLNRICLADGIPLVNIVRKTEHVELLRGQGAEHVVNSSEDSFRDDLAAALATTGATIAFDAIGGGSMASNLLATMERVLSAGAEFSRYGSNVKKQVYVYGRLDPSPIVLDQRFGLAWSVAGWLLTPFLADIGPDGQAKLRARVADEIDTTFASTYGTRLSLDDAVTVEHAQRYAKMASGDKALITPHA